MYNGYPDGEELDKISTWPHSDPVGWFGFIKSIWTYSNYWEEEDLPDKHRYLISTGGWSGNEDIIDSMEQNIVLWNLTFYSLRRGGHFIFELNKERLGTEQITRSSDDENDIAPAP